MKKRTLVLFLCVALAALVSVNETLATTVADWFNTLTHMLGELGTPTTGATLNVDVQSTTTGVLTPSHYTGDFEWSKVTPVVKKTWAENKAQEAAYVRISICVKTDDVIKYQPPTGDGFVTAAVTKNGYTVYNFDYTGTLASNGTTPVITMPLALTRDTDNEDLARIGTDFIKVKSFAIEADAFRQLNDSGEKITESTQDRTPMKPETALTHALGPMNTFDPFK